MDFSLIARRLREKIVRISGELSKKLDKTARRFVSEAVYGILSSQTVLLTELGRSLEGDVTLKKIIERFCRQLGKASLWLSIHKQLLSQVSWRIADKTLLILDISDIQKRYARKMEYVATVRDGSKKELGKGYWSLHVIAAELDSLEINPLYQTIYSQDAPDFVSENHQILAAISMISEHSRDRGIYVIDRGGDRGELLNPLLDAKRHFIIRMEGSRHLRYWRGKSSALELARYCSCPYEEDIVKEEDGKEKVFHISYGFLPVRLPDREEQLWMLVVKGFGEKPMMLLTTERLRKSRKVLRKSMLCYFMRWKIEETIRFLKQTYDLENIRLLRYNALRNMMALLLIAFHFLAVVLDTGQKLKILAGHILRSAKRVFGIPDFKYYALGDGLSAIFKRSPGKIVGNFAIPPPIQLELKFE
jgi:hypothetical protein